MKSKCMGKWTITKPTNADGSGGFTTYETSDVEEVRAAGRRGWGVSQHIEVDFGDDPEIDDRSLEEAAVVGYSSDTKATKQVAVTDEMVSRFLGWKLPQDFYPDCYVTFDREKASASQASWPSGTNLLHAGQARAMLEHVLAATSAIDAAPVRDVVEAWDEYFPDRTNEQAAVRFVLAMNKLRAAIAKDSK